MRAAAIGVLIAVVGLSHGRRKTIATDAAGNRESSESSSQVSQEEEEEEEEEVGMTRTAYNPAAALRPRAGFGDARALALSTLRSGRDLRMSPSPDTPSKVGIDGLSRRSTLSVLPAAAAVWAASLGGVRPAAADVALETFTEKFYCVSVGLPKGWEPITTSLTTRILVAAADPKDPDFQVNLLFTSIASDYTSLGSFGTIDYVAANTVIPPGSIAAGDVIEGKLLGQETVKGNYVYDYTNQELLKMRVKGEIQSTLLPKRRLRSLFAVLPGGEQRASSTLVTLTAQCLDSKYAEYEPIMKAVIDSYQKLGGIARECPVNPLYSKGS